MTQDEIEMKFIFTDLLQVFNETKTKLEFQSATWSHYKHHKTAEFLVCVFFRFHNDLDKVI